MVGEILKRIKENKPLVHHITNYVTVSECANITLFTGALPVMAHAKEEVEDMVKFASALVLNIGTLDPAQIDAMIRAGKKANELGIPVVLDPVGAGATPLRTESAMNILDEVKIAVIKGNSAEIGILAGMGGEIKGVEAVGKHDNILEAAKSLANRYGSVVVVTGKEDIITDGEKVAFVLNGHEYMGRIVGTGCMSASVVGAFVGVERNYMKAAVSAMSFFGIAGEIAASNVQGPSSFKSAFMDAVYNLTPEEADLREKIRWGE